MSMLTLGEASRLTGKSKPTISKAVKNGTISGQKGADGVFQIDRSELLRVYPQKSKVKETEAPKTQPSAKAETAVAAVEKKHLEEKVADLEARLAKAEDKADTAEQREREANARVFALIEDKTPKSFLQRLLGN